MGCGCLALVIALAFPRFAIVILWLFTRFFEGVFHGAIIPILGFLFLPYTLLWYTMVMRTWDGNWGLWQVLFLVVAFLADLGVFTGAGRRRRR